MKLEDFKYVFTIIGGGWTHIQDMYLITDNRIYYKKNFNPIYHDPKSHANFEISDTMKQLTTNSEFASEFENKALGFDEFDEDDDINPFTGQKRNTSGIVCKQTIENTN